MGTTSPHNDIAQLIQIAYYSLVLTVSRHVMEGLSDNIIHSVIRYSTLG